MISRIEVTHAQLLEWLHYDPATGYFTWRITKGRCAKKGSRAGSFDKKGYVVINLRINGRQTTYRAHRLAWFYVHGRWPESDIDHNKLDKADNRLDELREATRSQNMANTAAHADSLTGVKGVSFDKRRGRYYARIMKDGRHHHLGYFDHLEAAASAYASAAQRLFGEFARAA